MSMLQWGRDNRLGYPLPLIVCVLVLFSGVSHHKQNAHMLVTGPSAFHGNVGI